MQKEAKLGESLRQAYPKHCVIWSCVQISRNGKTCFHWRWQSSGIWRLVVLKKEADGLGVCTASIITAIHGGRTHIWNVAQLLRDYTAKWQVSSQVVG